MRLPTEFVRLPYRFDAFEENKLVSIATERFNAPLVMHPGEIDALTKDIALDMRAHTGNDQQVSMAFEIMLQNFRCEWRRLWSLYGQSRDGWPHYASLIKGVRLPPSELLLASNKGSAIRTFSARVLNAALNESLADQYQSDVCQDA